MLFLKYSVGNHNLAATVSGTTFSKTSSSKFWYWSLVSTHFNQTLNRREKYICKGKMCFLAYKNGIILIDDTYFWLIDFNYIHYFKPNTYFQCILTRGIFRSIWLKQVAMFIKIYENDVVGLLNFNYKSRYISKRFRTHTCAFSKKQCSTEIQQFNKNLNFLGWWSREEVVW